MLRLSQIYIEIRLQITFFCNNNQLQRGLHLFSNEAIMQPCSQMF